jgi:hypothetical protein
MEGHGTCFPLVENWFVWKVGNGSHIYLSVGLTMEMII